MMFENGIPQVDVGGGTRYYSTRVKMQLKKGMLEMILSYFRFSLFFFSSLLMKFSAFF